MIVPLVLAALVALCQDSPDDDERLFKLIRQSGDRWKEVLAHRQTQARSPSDKRGGVCGNYVREQDARERLRLARILARLGRWRDMHDTCRPTDCGWGTDELVIGYLESAVVLGRLPDAIREAELRRDGDGLNLSSSCFRRYVRALEFWSKEDLQGLMNLIEEEGRARGWQSIHPEDARKLTYLRALVELAGDLGDPAIEPLLARARRDPPNATGPLYAISAIRSARSKEIVNSWSLPLQAELLRTQEQPKRILAFGRAAIQRSTTQSPRIVTWTKVVQALLGLLVGFALFFLLRNRIVRPERSG